MIVPHFTDIRRHILVHLHAAKKEILVAVYWFTNTELFDCLCSKLQENVSVRLIVHHDYINLGKATGNNYQTFINLGGQLYYSDEDHPMHNKYCIIDGHILINGSYNWTYYAEMKNKENITVITEDEQTILAFQSEFNNLTSSMKQVVDFESMTFYQLPDRNQFDLKQYVAEEMLYKAGHLQSPNIAEKAIKLFGESVHIQQLASSFNFLKKRKLTCSIGLSIIHDANVRVFACGINTPNVQSAILKTVTDNQIEVATTVNAGESELASQNRPVIQVRLEGLPAMTQGQVKIEYDCTIDIHGVLRVTAQCLNNGSKKYFSANINHLLADQ